MNNDLLPIAEDFYSIQGEGYNTGKAAYFIRLAGCNVGCKWCDAKDSWNFRKYTPVETDIIIEKVIYNNAKNVVITGGEPLLYSLDYITEKLKNLGVNIFLETSGSSPFSGKFDWVCLSPKRALHPLDSAYSMADELKVVIEDFETDINWAKECAMRVKKSTKLYLQPEWSKIGQNLPLIIEFVKENPEWTISLQTHKFMNIP